MSPRQENTYNTGTSIIFLIVLLNGGTIVCVCAVRPWRQTNRTHPGSGPDWYSGPRFSDSAPMSVVWPAPVALATRQQLAKTAFIESKRRREKSVRRWSRRWHWPQETSSGHIGMGKSTPPKVSVGHKTPRFSCASSSRRDFSNRTAFTLDEMSFRVILLLWPAIRHGRPINREPGLIAKTRLHHT